MFTLFKEVLHDGAMIDVLTSLLETADRTSNCRESTSSLPTPDGAVPSQPVLIENDVHGSEKRT